MRESIGYVQDDGRRQTARLMAVAAGQIARLNERIVQLEAALSILDGASEQPPVPAAGREHARPLRAASSRR